MQALLKKISQPTEQSFVARIDDLPHTYDKWHFHPEIELTHIRKGSGKRYVGDNIEEFEEGDLVLIGSNLPHVWRNDIDYYKPDGSLRVVAEVVQFTPECFGKDFFNIPETKFIRELLDLASRGLKIKGKTSDKIRAHLSDLLSATNGIYRLNCLLRLLEELSSSREVVPLTSSGYLGSYHTNHSNTINKVYQFTHQNYYRKILIEEPADIANMSVSNFCRFFKSHSQKSYIQFLNEVRIGYACRMLMEDQKTIQQVAADCGFNNISNFNRQFLLLKKKQPKEFKNHFMKLHGQIH